MRRQQEKHEATPQRISGHDSFLRSIGAYVTLPPKEAAEKDVRETIGKHEGAFRRILSKLTENA